MERMTMKRKCGMFTLVLYIHMVNIGLYNTKVYIGWI